MKPLTEIVAELERRTGGIRTRSMEKTVSVNEIELCRLLAAFRVGEEMRLQLQKWVAVCKLKENHPSFDAVAAWDAAVRGDGE